MLEHSPISDGRNQREEARVAHATSTSLKESNKNRNLFGGMTNNTEVGAAAAL